MTAVQYGTKGKNKRIRIVKECLLCLHLLIIAMCAGKKQKKQKAREEEISGDDSVTEIGAKCRKELGLEEDDEEEKKSRKSGKKAKKRKGKSSWTLPARKKKKGGMGKSKRR